MASSKPSGTSKSKGTGDVTDKTQGQQPWDDAKPARAHRDDTGEAKRQQSGMPKSHPTRQSPTRHKGPKGNKA